MVPMPEILTKGLELGNSKQLQALWILKKIRGEEARAANLKNNYPVVFFKDKKPLFEMTVANKDVAVNISLKMRDFDDKKWKFDEIKHGTMKKGV